MPVILAGRLGSLSQTWDAQGDPGKRGSHRKTLTQKGCGFNEVMIRV